MSLLRRFSLRRARQLLRVLPLLVRLSWRLARDPRVPKRHKAVMLGALGYVVSPVDIALDIIPVIGRLDDLLIVAAGVAWALRFAPTEVVDEHLAELEVTRGEIATVVATLLPVPVEAAAGMAAQLLEDRRRK